MMMRCDSTGRWRCLGQIHKPMSDHLIHALPATCSSLASLFTAIPRHGYMPKPIRDCTIVPIPRSNKDPSSSDNYHPIALASTELSANFLSGAFFFLIL